MNNRGFFVNEARQYPGCGGDMKHCSDVHKNMHARNGEGDMILKFMWEKYDRPCPAPSCVQFHGDP